MPRLRSLVLSCFVVAFLYLPLPRTASGQVRIEQVQRTLTLFQRPTDHASLLRGFYSDKEISYDSNGAVKAHPGVWTVDGWIRIEKVITKGNSLLLRGRRLVAVFPDKKLTLWEPSKREVLLLVPLPQDQPGLEMLLKTVFFRSDESFYQALPDIWQEFFKSLADSPANVDRDKRAWNDPPVLKEVAGVQYYTYGKGVKPPRGVFTPDPNYNPVAKAAKLQGTVVLWVIVGPDQRVHLIRLARPLGVGLDEDAVAAVQQWRFEPASYQDNAVPVSVNIEVNFRWY